MLGLLGICMMTASSAVPLSSSCCSIFESRSVLKQCRNICALRPLAWLEDKISTCLPLDARQARYFDFDRKADRGAAPCLLDEAVKTNASRCVYLSGYPKSSTTIGAWFVSSLIRSDCALRDRCALREATGAPPAYTLHEQADAWDGQGKWFSRMAVAAVPAAGDTLQSLVFSLQCTRHARFWEAPFLKAELDLVVPLRDPREFPMSMEAMLLDQKQIATPFTVGERQSRLISAFSEMEQKLRFALRLACARAATSLRNTACTAAGWSSGPRPTAGRGGLLFYFKDELELRPSAVARQVINFLGLQALQALPGEAFAAAVARATTPPPAGARAGDQNMIVKHNLSDPAAKRNSICRWFGEAGWEGVMDLWRTHSDSLTTALFQTYSCHQSSKHKGKPAGRASTKSERRLSERAPNPRAHLPVLDGPGMRAILTGLSGSTHCREACRTVCRTKLRCPPTRALNYAEPLQGSPTLHFQNGSAARVRCGCVKPRFSPTKPPATSGVALLIAGQTRSFASPPVRSALKGLLNRLRPAQVSMLTVLTVESRNRTSRLDQVLQSYGVPWRARYLTDGPSQWSEMIAACTNQALRSLLAATQRSRIDRHSGPHNSLAKRVVVFDLLLAYEQSANATFERVLFLRPDIAYFASTELAATKCSAVYVLNDLFASMPRNLAGYYFTSYATALALDGRKGQTEHELGALRQRIRQTKQVASPAELGLGGLVLMPHFHLAYHGMPFAGVNLEMQPNNIECNGYIPLTGFAFVRDLPAAVNSDRVCINERIKSRGRPFAQSERLRDAGSAAVRQSFNTISSCSPPNSETQRLHSFGKGTQLPQTGKPAAGKCELRIQGACSGYPDMSDHFWFPDELYGGPAGPATELQCLARRDLWQRSCGNGSSPQWRIGTWARSGRRQVVITGTGRAGTTFLMQVLTHLRLPTGFTPDEFSGCADVYRCKHAGYEWGELSAEMLPRLLANGIEIVKSTQLAVEAEARRWLSSAELEHVILPVRDLTNSALSRAKQGHENGGLPQGIEDTAEMQRFNEQLLSHLVVLLAQKDVSHTLLDYPRHVLDARYAYQKLSWLCDKYGVTEAAFLDAHNRVSRPRLVHATYESTMSNTSGRPRARERKPVPFIILMLPTSGSSWLQELLDSHPQIGCLDEQFNFQDVRDALLYLKGGRAADKVGLVARGFKISRWALTKPAGPLSCRDLAEANASYCGGGDVRFHSLLDGLRASHGKLVCLGRRNYVKHAISRIRHRQQLHACGDARTHVEDAGCLLNVSSNLPIEKDGFGFSLAQNIEMARDDHSRMLRECMLGQVTHYNSVMSRTPQTMVLFYEDLLQHTKHVLTGLQEWLGAQPLPLASSLIKVTGTSLRHELSNFGEVESDVIRNFGGGSYEHVLLLEE